MSELVEKIIHYICIYYADDIYLTIAIFAYLYLYVYYEELRCRFLLPIGMLAFCVVNPLMYRFVLRSVTYWRLLWMIPDAIIIALAVTLLVKNAKPFYAKIFISGIFVFFIMFKGSNVYIHGKFEFIKNPYKISEVTIEVCDYMLEISDSPRCIAPASIFSEVRQYSGEIQMLYGRNANGYISSISEENRQVYLSLESEKPEYDLVFDVATKNDINFVIANMNCPVEEKILNEYEYTLINQIAGYNIYYKGK